MLQLGQYEELGSGVRRVNQYLPFYAPGAGKPVFEDDEMFTVTVPLRMGTGQITGHVAGQVTEEVPRLLKVMDGEQNRTALQAKLKLSGRANFLKLVLP